MEERLIRSGEQTKLMKEQAYKKSEEETIQKAKMLIPPSSIQSDKVIERLHCYRKIYDLKNKMKQLTAIDV